MLQLIELTTTVYSMLYKSQMSRGCATETKVWTRTGFTVPDIIKSKRINRRGMKIRRCATKRANGKSGDGLQRVEGKVPKCGRTKTITWKHYHMN
jgi:hypothetical protein